MHQTFEISNPPKKLILVSVELPETSDARESVEELKELCHNLNAVVVEAVSQKRASLHPGTCVGEGKIEEIKELVEENQADGVVFDLELTPSQIKNLNKLLGTDVKDRTMIILDIFADRANSSEGKIQVELARLEYMLPRLKGSYQSLSRIRGSTGGTGAAKGLGESKLELDKRYIRKKISSLKQQLAEVQRHRETLRAKRLRQNVTTVAICGYTNAGKSTLLNALTEADVLAEDMLFATLDTTSRALMLPDKREIMLIDTVGFIRRLPHNLIEAFKSTLEETLYADLVLLLIDASSAEYNIHHDVSLSILKDLKYTGKILTVFNKCDRIDDVPVKMNSVCVSAKQRTGLDELLSAIAAQLEEDPIAASLLIPYRDGKTLARAKNTVSVLSEEYLENGVRLGVKASLRRLNDFKEYLEEPHSTMQNS